MTKTFKQPCIPKFHTIKNVADQLHISARSVQRLIDSGALPTFKFGASVRVSDDDLQLLVARSRQSKAQES